MFNQFFVKKEEECFLAMLWRSFEDRDPDVYVNQRHIFGATSSPTCANYALQQAGRLAETKYPGITELIRRVFYVDDYYLSLDNEEVIIKKTKEIQDALLFIGCELLKFISNKVSVVKAFPKNNKHHQ
jgi:hypothetical protein